MGRLNNSAYRQVGRLVIFGALSAHTAVTVAEWASFGGKSYSLDEFAQQGIYCGTHPPTTSKSVRVMQDLERQAESRSFLQGKAARVEIPVHFHVVSNTDGAGALSKTRLQGQVEHLNATFGRYGVGFRLASIDRVTNDDWFDADRETPDGRRRLAEMKKNLVKSPEESLNFYTVSFSGGLLGYAQFPWDLAERPETDGVVLLHEVVKGGGTRHDGDVPVHEVGHWLGLLHVFQGGCQAPGDQVTDTPAQAQPLFGTCRENRAADTCPGDGPDPIANYMNYTDASCMAELSSGQVERIKLAISKYRPALLTSGNNEDEDLRRELNILIGR